MRFQKGNPWRWMTLLLLARMVAEGDPEVLSQREPQPAGVRVEVIVAPAPLPRPDAGVEPGPRCQALPGPPGPWAPYA